ncbi:LysR family transcriptional regulator [Paroceanicella profunda]|uniref:HTH-type transcriptional regulator CbbR n=1 Tax=Paroceanicella profunda TaxID=2579971 RepID=A0A5B8FI01_9RHOB|nr:LysR family transcriptional regulator [Paroceanicella profunda]QDL92787.1 LysR family transcriptional regulator [Paroceanicella profunda]
MAHENAITLKQLRALAAIVEAGTLTAAAQTLSVTAPAVSTQLRTLEAHLDVRLLHRNEGGPALPTPEGREILLAVSEVESVLERCFARIAAIRAGKAGRVALGVVSTGKYFAPGIVAAARRALPDIEVGLIVGNRGEVIEALRRRAIDLAIMGRPPREPAVEAAVLGPHPHVLIAPPEHPLAGRCDITPEALLAETFLVREPGSGTRILAERILDRIGDGQPYDTVEMNSNETIKQAVIAGLGVAIISRHTVLHELDAGRLVTLAFAGLPIERQWFLIHRAGVALSHTAAALHRFILDQKGHIPG